MPKKKDKWWNLESTPVAVVVKAFGGPTKAATAIGVHPGVISNWRSRGEGQVPHWWWETILKKNKTVTLHNLQYGEKWQ